MARPIKKIDIEQLKQLCAINCSAEEISQILQIDHATLYRRYAKVMQQARANGKMSLKRKAYVLATQKDDTKMLIFLLKNQCGYSDRIVYEGEASPHKEDYARPDSMKLEEIKV